jgi:hypothetical protein
MPALYGPRWSIFGMHTSEEAALMGGDAQSYEILQIHGPLDGDERAAVQEWLRRHGITTMDLDQDGLSFVRWPADRRIVVAGERFQLEAEPLPFPPPFRPLAGTRVNLSWNAPHQGTPVPIRPTWLHHPAT